MGRDVANDIVNLNVGATYDLSVVVSIGSDRSVWHQNTRTKDKSQENIYRKKCHESFPWVMAKRSEFRHLLEAEYTREPPRAIPSSADTFKISLKTRI